MSVLTRSRSPTPQYSDSFESGESPQRTRMQKRKLVTKTLQTGARGPTGAIRSHPYLSQLKKLNSRANHVKGSDGMFTPDHLDESVKRLLSSRSRKINELTSQVLTLKKKIDDLQSEVKTLRTQSYRQEKALEKIDHAQTEIPTLLNHQDAEMKMLREQSRRLKEQLAAETDKRREIEASNAKYKQHLLKLKELTEDRSLPERDELQRTLNALKNEITEKNKRIAELEKYVENLQKNYKRERSQDAERYKTIVHNRQELAQKFSQVQELLREKEKQLELHNIYTHRIRLRGTVDNGSNGSLHYSEPLSSQRQTATPQDRIMSYESQRRKSINLSGQRSQSMRAKKLPINDTNTRKPGLLKKDVLVTNDFKKIDKLNGMEESISEEEEITNILEKEPAPLQQHDIFNAQLADQEVKARAKREQQEAERVAREKREQQEAERLAREKQLIMNLEVEKAERRRREEFERKERERLEDERIREEFAERERKQKEEEERRLQMEQEKLREAAEERRRKDELLRLLATVDGNLEDGDRERKAGDFSVASKKPVNEYFFTESVENLHRGRPTGDRNARMSLEKDTLPPLKNSSYPQPDPVSPIFDLSRDQLIDENQNSDFVTLPNQHKLHDKLHSDENPSQPKKPPKYSQLQQAHHSDDIEEFVL